MLEKYKLIVFDVDGTLVEDYNSDTLLPNVVGGLTILNNLRLDARIGFASNQGGVGFRMVAENAGWEGFEKYPTAEYAQNRLVGIQNKVQILSDYECLLPVFCFQWCSKDGRWVDVPENASELSIWGENAWLPFWRKPNYGMLEENASLAKVEPEEVLFVGNGDEDLRTALNFGCSHCYPTDFWRIVEMEHETQVTR